MGAVRQATRSQVGSRLIETAEVARIFGGVSKRTIWRWADLGILPKGFRVGGKRFWCVSAIEEAVAALERQGK